MYCVLVGVFCYLSLGGVVAGSIDATPIQQEIEISLNPEITPARTETIKAPKVQLNLLDFIPVIRNLRKLKRAKKAKGLEPDTYFVPKGELVLELKDSLGNLIEEKRHSLTMYSAIAWEELASDFDVSEDGNLSIYIDNSSSDKVYFDEFIIERTEAAVAVVVQENHYYPFGMNMKGIEELDLQSIEGDDEHRFQYNGKEKEESFGLNWTDYGWRNMDTQLGRWHGVDNLAEKYQSISPYVYVANSPLIATDPDGMRVYFVVYTSSKDFQPPAETRKREIENSEGFDKEKDHIYMIQLDDLGKLKEKIESSVKDAGEKGYGKTVEFSMYAHGAGDGPRGEVAASSDGLDKVTGDNLDRSQLSPSGWKSINFNFDSDESLAAFYGCNSSEFALRFLNYQNVQFTAGLEGKAGDTYNLDDWSSVWFPYDDENVYMAIAEGGKVLPTAVYSRKSLNRRTSFTDSEGNRIYDKETQYVKGNVTLKNGKAVSGSLKSE